jgi:putative PIN family toxin of toxin-antitoxin system
MIFQNSSSFSVAKHIIDNFEVIVSLETLAELAYVMYKPKLRKYVELEKLVDYFEYYKSITTVVPIISTVQLCRDAKDDKFLELAVNGNADFIITGDDDLLILNPFENTKIISPTKYLEDFIKNG